MAHTPIIEGSHEHPFHEHDLLFNAYFEGDLTQEERAEFESRLERDELFRCDYQAFVGIMGGLRDLPLQFAPDDFVEQVTSRIRRRSRGRFFAEHYLYRNRVPYEVIAVVMMAVMAAAYMMMESPRDTDLRTADVTIDAAPPSPSKLE
ncbi:MAG: hypothetical protein AAGI01_17380 [Myxococcota bacterium]